MGLTLSSPRRRARSPAAAPLDDEDLLTEILIRLSPQPSALPRASLVCTRWRGLVSDPRFLRRFLLRHGRRSPPLLGFIVREANTLRLRPVGDPPDRVPAERFSSLKLDGAEWAFRLLDCRHGLVLISDTSRNKVLVWDPATGGQHWVAVPPGFDRERTPTSWAVLRAAGEEIHHFQLVLVGNDERKITRALACVYSSATGEWGDFVSAELPTEVSVSGYPAMVVRGKPAVMVGNSLYWLLTENLSILEFDLERQRLDVIPVPVKKYSHCRFSVIRADGGGLGFLFLPDYHAQLWKRNTDCDGVASWVLERTIELDKLLSLSSQEGRGPLMMVGLAEYNNAVFLWTVVGLFMVDLESMKFKKLFKTDVLSCRHPFESVYVAERVIVGGHNRAEILHNA